MVRDNLYVKASRTAVLHILECRAQWWGVGALFRFRAVSGGAVFRPTFLWLNVSSCYPRVYSTAIAYFAFYLFWRLWPLIYIVLARCGRAVHTTSFILFMRELRQLSMKYVATFLRETFGVQVSFLHTFGKSYILILCYAKFVLGIIWLHANSVLYKKFIFI